MQLPTVADAHKVPEELEQRVADRTATLVKTNQRLRHEIKERKQTEETIRKEHRSWPPAALFGEHDLPHRPREPRQCPSPQSEHEGANPSGSAGGWDSH